MNIIRVRYLYILMVVGYAAILLFYRDYRPAAEHHYLVIPKKHFRKIPTLTRNDIPMIRRMEKIGMEVI